jgi:hypothetical protein
MWIELLTIYTSTPKMEAACCFETFISGYKTIWTHNRNHQHLNFYFAWLSYCDVYEWLQTRFGLVIRFTDHLLQSRLGTASDYSATADLHNSQITTAPATSFPACCVLTSRSLATAFNSGNFSASHAQVVSSQAPVQNYITTGSVPCLWYLSTDHVETPCFQQ